MIDYYIFLPGDKEEDVWCEDHLLGTDNGRGLFWTGTGLKALTKIAERNPELLESVKIKNSKGNYVTVQDFIILLDRLKIST